MSYLVFFCVFSPRIVRCMQQEERSALLFYGLLHPGLKIDCSLLIHPALKIIRYVLRTVTSRTQKRNGLCCVQKWYIQRNPLYTVNSAPLWPCTDNATHTVARHFVPELFPSWDISRLAARRALEPQLSATASSVRHMAVTGSRKPLWPLYHWRWRLQIPSKRRDLLLRYLA